MLQLVIPVSSGLRLLDHVVDVGGLKSNGVGVAEALDDSSQKLL